MSDDEEAEDNERDDQTQNTNTQRSTEDEHAYPQDVALASGGRKRRRTASSISEHQQKQQAPQDRNVTLGEDESQGSSSTLTVSQSIATVAAFLPAFRQLVDTLATSSASGKHYLSVVNW